MNNFVYFYFSKFEKSETAFYSELMIHFVYNKVKSSFQSAPVVVFSVYSQSGSKLAEYYASLTSFNACLSKLVFFAFRILCEIDIERGC